MSTIFVFGSNLAGRHGKGSALHARIYHGAITGRSVGRQGMSYAIPTRSENLITLPLSIINLYVSEFLDYARSHPELSFKVTRIGCGLAGYCDCDISPMFKYAPSNCTLPKEWTKKGKGHD